MKKSKFIIATERKTILHRGVLPVKILELFLIPDNELKPVNIKNNKLSKAL